MRFVRHRKLMSDDQPQNAQAARTIAQVRKLMAIAAATTLIAIAAVYGVIGYRVFRSGESVPPPAFVDVSGALPAGAKVLSTAVSSEHIVVTVETAAGVEVLTFDPDTLRPLGRLRLETKP
jgi:hypothetical protein